MGPSAALVWWILIGAVRAPAVAAAAAATGSHHAAAAELFETSLAVAELAGLDSARDAAVRTLPPPERVPGSGG